MPPNPIKQKVLAYITQKKAGHLHLLVFDHRDFPDAGVQVIAGTVEPGEDPADVLHREILEESGLTHLRLLRKLGETPEPAWNCHRHYFHLEAPPATPDRWDWTTNDFHDEAHRLRNDPLVFSFHWLPLTPRLTLAGNQHRLLGQIQ